MQRGGQSGSAVLEFALLAPILMSLMLGMFDLGPTLMVRFKLGNATQAVADLATQSATMQSADIVDFFAAGADVLAPFSATNLKFRITNVATDGNGRAFVYWSCGSGSLSPFTALSTVTSTPNGVSLSNLLQLTQSKSGNYTLSGRNTSYVMVESSYNYTAPAGFIFPSVQNMSVVSYVLPRVSTYIGATDGSASYVPAPPVAAKGSYSSSLNGVSCNIGV